MQARQYYFYQLLALVVTLIWGLNYLSTKVLFLHGLGPWGVLAIKIALAWGALWLLSPKWFFADNPHHELMFALLGITFVPLYHGLESFAIYHGQVASISAVMACAPLMTAAIAVSNVRHVKVHWTMWMGIFVAITGILLLLIDDSIIFGLPPEGIYLALGAALSWAIYSMFLKSFAGYPASFILRKALGYGLLFAVPLAYWEGMLNWDELKEPVVWGNLAFLAFGVMVLAAVLWVKITQEIGGNGVQGWNYLIPIVANIGAVWLLNEQISFVGVMGLVMVLCGVWAGQYGAKRISAVFSTVDAVPS